MTRNAELERQLATTNSCDAVAYEESAENRRWEGVREAIEQIEKDLSILVKVAGFNPKGPING